MRGALLSQKKQSIPQLLYNGSRVVSRICAALKRVWCGLDRLTRFSSEPFFAFADQGQQDHGDDGKDDDKEIAVAPGELRHGGKVHPIPADDNGQREKHAGQHGEDFHGAVHL